MVSMFLLSLYIVCLAYCIFCYMNSFVWPLQSRASLLDTVEPKHLLDTRTLQESRKRELAGRYSNWKVDAVSLWMS